MREAGCAGTFGNWLGGSPRDATARRDRGPAQRRDCNQCLQSSELREDLSQSGPEVDKWEPGDCAAALRTTRMVMGRYRQGRPHQSSIELGPQGWKFRPMSCRVTCSWSGPGSGLARRRSWRVSAGRRCSAWGRRRAAKTNCSRFSAVPQPLWSTGKIGLAPGGHPPVPRWGCSWWLLGW